MDFFEGLDKYFETNYLIKNQNEEVLDINHTGSSYYRFYNFIKENNFNKPYEFNFNRSDSLGLLVFLLKICKDVLSELNTFNEFESIHDFAKQNIVFQQNNDNDIVVNYDCEKYLIANDKEISEYAKLQFNKCFDKIKELLINNLIIGKTLKEKINNLYELSLKYDNKNIQFAIKLMLLQLKIEYDNEFNLYFDNLIKDFKDNQNVVNILKFLNNNIKKEIYFINKENNITESISIVDINFKDDKIITKNNEIKKDEFDLKFEYLFDTKDIKNINPDLKQYLKNPDLEDETKMDYIQKFLEENSNRKFFLTKFRDSNQINEYSKLHIVAKNLNIINNVDEINDTYSYFSTWDVINANYRKSINEFIQNNYNTNENKIDLLIDIFENENIANNNIKYLVADYVIKEYIVNLDYIFNKDIKIELLSDNNSNYYKLYEYLYKFGFVDNINIINAERIIFESQIIEKEEIFKECPKEEFKKIGAKKPPIIVDTECEVCDYIKEEKSEKLKSYKNAKEIFNEKAEEKLIVKEKRKIKCKYTQKKSEKLLDMHVSDFAIKKEISSKQSNIQIDPIFDKSCDYIKEEKSEKLKSYKNAKEIFNEKAEEKLIDFKEKNRRNSIVVNNPKKLKYIKYQYGLNKITGISNSLKNTFTTAGGYITKENIITFAEKYIDSDFKNIYDHININIVKGSLSEKEQNEIRMAITKNIINEIIPMLKEQKAKEEEINIIQQENKNLIKEKKELAKKFSLYENMDLIEKLNDLEAANKELDERNNKIYCNFNNTKQALDNINKKMLNKGFIIGNTKYVF